MRKHHKKAPSTSAAVLSHHALYEDVQLLVTELAARRLVLVIEHNTVIIWSPCVKVPKWIQRGVFKHRQALIKMIADADMMVCPTPQLHKRYHKRGVCLACKRIDSSFLYQQAPEAIAS